MATRDGRSVGRMLPCARRSGRYTLVPGGGRPQALAKGHRMKLFGRLMTTFAVLAILPLVVMGGVWLTVQRHRLMVEERRQVGMLTSNGAAQIDVVLSRAVEQVKQLARFLSDDEGLRSANLRYEGRNAADIQAQLTEEDRRWVAAPDDAPSVRTIISNTMAQRLRRFERVAPSRYAEIMVTDRAGALYAATNRTTDFYQADEAWWQDCFNAGRGAVVISAPVYDESAQTVSLAVAAPLYDPGGGVVGVVRVSHDVYSLLRAISMLSMGKTGAGHMVDAQGRALLSAADSPQLAPLPPDVVSTMLQTQSGMVTRPLDPDGLPSVIGFQVLSSTRGESGPVVADGPWFVLFAQSAHEVYAPSRALLLWGALVLLLPLGGLALLAYCLQRWLLGPIKALHWASQQVAEGHLDVRVEMASNDELEDVGHEFNRMAGALQRHEETQRSEIRRRTEELRQTDLQARRMHDSVSAAMRSVAGQVSAALNALQKEVDRGEPDSPTALQSRDALRALSEDLQDLSDAASTQARPAPGPVDLRSALESARRMLRPLAELHRVTVELPEGELPTVTADRPRLKQVLYGLLSNAIKYGGPGSTVKVGVRREDGATCVSVSDEGAGPPTAAKSGIFYLLSATPGEAPEDRIGLALPIIKSLVEMQGGQIRVEGQPGQGSTFSFTLPDPAPAEDGPADAEGAGG